MEHVTILCLIYGMRTPDFCVAALPQFESVLAERLGTLAFNESEQTARAQTLSTLAKQLEASRSNYDD